MARRELGPATLLVAQAVDGALTEADAALVVACSGGPDSLALAAATLPLARRRRLPVSAVTVDHGLQAGSAEQADETREQLLRLGYSDVAAVRAEVDLTAGHGTEAAARASRYQALETEAGRRQATVLLGHTLDDQAETVLLGLARGSGTRSLAGMAVRSGRLLRPLLSLTRAVTAQACAELGLTVWRDPHNSDDAYARSRVRKRVLPVMEAEIGPGITAALARTALLARDDADLLDALAGEAHPITSTLDCTVLAATPPALRRRVIRRWLVRQGAREPTYEHVLGVERLVTDWHGQAGIDVPGLQVTRVGKRMPHLQGSVAG